MWVVGVEANNRWCIVVDLCFVRFELCNIQRCRQTGINGFLSHVVLKTVAVSLCVVRLVSLSGTCLCVEAPEQCCTPSRHTCFGLQYRLNASLQAIPRRRGAERRAGAWTRSLLPILTI